MAKIYAIKERSEATDGSPLTLILQDGVGVAPNLLPQEALLELEML